NTLADERSGPSSKLRIAGGGVRSGLPEIWAIEQRRSKLPVDGISPYFSTADPSALLVARRPRLFGEAFSNSRRTATVSFRRGVRAKGSRQRCPWDSIPAGASQCPESRSGALGEVAHVGQLVEGHFTRVTGRGEMEADRPSSEGIGHGLPDHRPD